MVSTMTCKEVARPEVIQQMRDDYLHTLVAPMDGMWESTVITHAVFWEIRDRAQQAGFFCLDPHNQLLRFHLGEGYRAWARETFRWIIVTYAIRHAIASTIEPRYFSLCLDLQVGVVPHTYLFRDHRRVAQSPAPGDRIYRKVRMSEWEDVVRLYRANTEGSGEWLEGFLRERLEGDELTGMYERQALVAVGECIPSQTQPPYADLGMVVARSCRGRGLGCAMLLHLKQHCYEAGWEPICSCAADNEASRRAIERAGFISEQRMMTIRFS